MSSANNSKIVLTVNDWDVKSIKYMKPRILDKGSKSISIISKQTNRMLHLSTPLMMTWGISDYTDEKGESDGKYTISLNFPNDEYRNEATDAFLQKLQDFEEQILDDAEKMSEEWWGKKMSREICKYSLYPILKKNKDPTKPPSIRAKVPMYDGKWKVEIYDTKQKLLFPCEDESLTPIDFVPKLSNVACGLQCVGIWIGGKGWGVSWKLFQCVVKPREIVSITGCCIALSPDEKNIIEKQEIQPHPDDDVEPEETTELRYSSVINNKAKTTVVEEPASTFVEDSDDEKDTKEIETMPEPPLPQPMSEPVAQPEPPQPVIEKEKPIVKKTVKKVVSTPPVETVATVATEDVTPPPPAPEQKKKVIKKVVK